MREGNKIYFHSAKAGHKNDAIKANPKVSFFFVDKDDIVCEEYTTYFRSAHIFGNATFVEDEEELYAVSKVFEELLEDIDIER